MSMTSICKDKFSITFPDDWYKISKDMDRLDRISQGVESLLIMDYEEFKLHWEYYKNSIFWISLKDKRRKLVGNMCEVCHDMTSFLELHHDFYPDYPFVIFDSVETVRLLCRKCHDNFFKNNPGVCPSKSFFIEMQFRYRDFRLPDNHKKSNFVWDKSYF